MNTDDSESEEIGTIKKLNEFIKFGIPKTLLIELKNIKNTLKISSYEIERIFEIPLKSLKDDKGNPVHFNLEKMHLEEFSNILLKDNFISNLIENIRLINTQLKIKEINELLNQFSDEELNHQNEMTRFNEFLNNKFKLEDLFSSKGFAKTSPSSLGSAKDGEQMSNNIEDIDELVKYINEETDSKKPKKNKNKKNKKNNKNNNQGEDRKTAKQNEYLVINKSIDSKEIEGDEELKENLMNHESSNVKITDETVEEFRKEIESISFPSYMCQKIIPKISVEFLNMLDEEYLSK